jgi:tRNA pseudouridine32 synthase/23S rRNA pseudouridine746 synthase
VSQLSSPFELHVPIESAAASAVESLAQASGLSKRCLKDAMTKGAVWHTRGKRTQRLRRASAQARPGETLHLYYDERILAREPPEPELIADEGAYSVWFKPYGMLSQGSKWGDHCTLGRWSERRLEPQRTAFVVHRLDRAATGLMLLAHRKRTAAALSAAFAQREVEKRYLVIVEGSFPCDAIQPIEAEIDGRAARSLARGVRHDAALARTLVEVTIETGRKHQIRRHLAGLGFPVVGDRLHGRAEADAIDLQLTACELAFACPESGVRREYTLPERLRPKLG